MSLVTRQSSPKLEHFQRLECRRFSVSTPELGLQDRALTFSPCSRPPWGVWLCPEEPSPACFPPPPPHFHRVKEAQNHLASHFSWRTYGLGLHVLLAFSGPDPTLSVSLISPPWISRLLCPPSRENPLAENKTGHLLPPQPPGPP